MDKDFYLKNNRRARNTFTCYNERMMLHFGEHGYRKNNLEMDYDSYKEEYKQLYFINPRNIEKHEKNEPIPQSRQDRLMEKMREHTEKHRFHKLDFE